MKLSDKTCSTAQKKEKAYKLSDGGGLYLEVMPSGSKYWRLKYRLHNKEKRYAIGVYPQISLKEARDERTKAKQLIANNIDPTQDKQLKKTLAQQAADNTFEAIALEWMQTQQPRWSAGYTLKIKQALENNIFPFIGKRPISEITPPELLLCLRKMESRGTFDIAQRAKQTCGRVFRYGIQTGRCEWDIAQNLTGALKTHKKEHFRSMDIKELPKFISALERNEARLYERTRRAVWLSLYTFCRPAEIRQARWQDIDIENKLWTIPAQFMKLRRDHIVPLSDQAIKILEAQRAETALFASDWVFPSQIKSRNPMSDGTVNKAIKSLGFGQTMVAHGFRALARTTIAEQLRYPAEAIEKQLAHKTNNPLGEAYDRTQFLDQRVEMMQAWADYLEGVQ